MASKVFDANTECTDVQNAAKTKSAQAVLDCGEKKCKTSEGNAQQEQDCLCSNCVAEDKAAREASCACGLADANSKVACGIYKRLYSSCSARDNHSSWTIWWVIIASVALIIGAGTVAVITRR